MRGCATISGRGVVRAVSRCRKWCLALAPTASTGHSKCCGKLAVTAISVRRWRSATPANACWPPPGLPGRTSRSRSRTACPQFNGRRQCQSKIANSRRRTPESVSGFPSMSIRCCDPSYGLDVFGILHSQGSAAYSSAKLPLIPRQSCPSGRLFEITIWSVRRGITKR